MKQKIVIKVAMACDKCRSKAMALVAATGGVESVAIVGDQVVLVGDGVGVDSIKLTRALRRKVGPAQLVEVADATEKKDDKKKKSADDDAVPECPCPFPYPYRCYPPYPPHPVSCVPYNYEQGPHGACTIL